MLTLRKKNFIQCFKEKKGKNIFKNGQHTDTTSNL